MNNVAFIQLLVQVYEKFLISYKDGLVTVNINGQTWSENTLEQCINSIKQSLAIKYLEEKK